MSDRHSGGMSRGCSRDRADCPVFDRRDRLLAAVLAAEAEQAVIARWQGEARQGQWVDLLLGQIWW
ncbi:hypothetical protein D3C72_331780 [compost metagenome]